MYRIPLIIGNTFNGGPSKWLKTSLMSRTLPGFIWVVTEGLPDCSRLQASILYLWWNRPSFRLAVTHIACCYGNFVPHGPGRNESYTQFSLHFAPLLLVEEPHGYGCSSKAYIHLLWGFLWGSFGRRNIA